jgi:outer membrane protein TolC
MSRRRLSRAVVGALLLVVSPAPGQEPAAVEEPGPPPSTPAAKDAPLPAALPAIPPGAPLTLERALRAADGRNLSLLATRAEIEKAEADLYRAWAALFPAAGGKLTLTHLDEERAMSFGSTRIVTQQQNSLTGALEVGMPLVSPSAWIGVRAGRHGERVAELTVAQARQALLLTVAQAYYQALTAAGMIEVYEGQIRSTARHLEIARVRLVSGVGARLDVVRARSDLARTREALIGAHAALSDSRDVLGTLTGIGGLPMPSEVRELPPVSASEEDLVRSGVERREDLLLQQALADGAGIQVDLAWMQFLPSLNASWQLTHQFTGSNGQDRTGWAAYLVLSVPIYTQTRYADLDRGRAAARQAELRVEDARLSAVLAIRRARRAYLTTLDRIAVAAEQADLARETLELTVSEYVSGTGSSLAVSDARRTSREAEIGLVTRRFEAQVALLGLLRATGEDLSALQP